jgi:hypothetical protein
MYRAGVWCPGCRTAIDDVDQAGPCPSCCRYVHIPRARLTSLAHRIHPSIDVDTLIGVEWQAEVAWLSDEHLAEIAALEIAPPASPVVWPRRLARLAVPLAALALIGIEAVVALTSGLPGIWVPAAIYMAMTAAFTLVIVDARRARRWSPAYNRALETYRRELRSRELAVAIRTAAAAARRS